MGCGCTKECNFFEDTEAEMNSFENNNQIKEFIINIIKFSIIQNRYLLLLESKVIKEEYLLGKQFNLE
jgi:hypothetical protein